MSSAQGHATTMWSSRLAFILAATGSAVGLGNIWKFPYITGENGGGAFVLVYLVCIAVIGIPIMMAEILIGRRGRQNPIFSVSTIAKQEKKSPAWASLAWVSVLAAFLILSFYSVIGGWAIAYAGKAVTGAFNGLSADSVGNIFGTFLADPIVLTAWHTLFIALVITVVAGGIKAGLERAVMILMPLMFVLMVLLVGYSMTTSGFGQGLEFLFKPDFSKLTTEGILVAMGHAFFTLSLGMGVMLAYGSYVPQDTSIVKTSIIVAIMDTVVALMAGIAIFPIVFSNGLEASAGPGLIFQTLPLAFSKMPGGIFFASLFFILLIFAAWTSAISLLEPVVEWFEEKQGVPRKASAIIIGVLAWLVGLASVLSLNIWADVAPLGFISAFEGKTVFDLLDFFTANVMLPLAGLLAALFVGWGMSQASTREELNMGDGYAIWRFLIRYVTPIAVLIVFIYNL